MALVLQPGTRVLDASGVAVSGGQVRVYEANTTTPADLFSDAALSVPLANPVVCNSTGYPSSNGTTPTLVFAAAANYDVAFLNSVAAGSGVIRSWEDVPGLGSDESTFFKDFTNSRFAIRGAGGTIYQDFGDASPDDTGGTGSLGGWLGTQANLITINSALVNAGTSTGALKENSKKLSSTVYTEATTFTAVASVDIALPNSPTGVRGWEVEIFDYSQTGTVVNWVRLSFDGGGTYNSGGTDYDYQYGSFISGTGGASTAHSNAAQIQINANLNGATNKLGRIKLTILTPRTGTTCTQVISDSRGVVSTGEYGEFFGVGYGPASAGPCTHARLMLSGAQTMTGKYLVRPLRGYGET